MAGKGSPQNPIGGLAKITNEVTVLSQSVSARREMIKKMLNTCNHKDASCPVCASLQRKLEPIAETQAVTVQPTSIEQEQSRIVRQYFLLCNAVAEPGQGSMDSEKSVGQQMVTIDSTAMKHRTSSIVAGGAEAAVEAVKGPRDSVMTDAAAKHRGENQALNYGLHNLIQDIELEPGRNHRAVFANLEQSQLHSLLAQITCKDTLFKESESNARLLRIEQELNDLMAMEDASRAAFDIQHEAASIAGGVSKKPDHEHRY